MSEILVKSSMGSGEISSALYSRVDQELYYSGLRACRNFMVRQYGGVENRPGTRFTAECMDSSTKTRLVPFQFNEEQTYVLELGHYYMRVIKDGAQVVESETAITGITQANPVVVSATAHGFSNGDDIYISDIFGMVELNGRSLRVKNKTANTFELIDYEGTNIDSTAFAAYTSGGTVAKIYEIVTPWDELALAELNYVQSNDVITFFHKDFYTRDVTRTDHDSWTLAKFDAKEGPFKDVNSDEAITVYASAETGSVTITASTAIFNSDMVGDFFYMEQLPNDSTNRWEPAKGISATDLRRSDAHYYEAATSGTTGTIKPEHTDGNATDGDNGVEWEYLHSGFGIVEITGFTSSTAVTATVIRRLPANVVGSGNATDVWANAAWSYTEGYPSAGAYFNQRFVMGGTAERPNGLWMSGTGARTYFGNSFPILDDEAITLYLDAQKVNSIRHLIPMSGLVALTSSNEQVVNGAGGVILATDPPYVETQGETGSAHVQPIMIESTVLFVQEMGGIVRTLQYQRDASTARGVYRGVNLVSRSNHLFTGRKIVDWDYQRHPASVVWACMSDGALLGLTYMEEQEVIAWHRHDSNGAKFESVCCIREGEETAAYFVVNRTVNGIQKRFIERMASRQFNDVVDAYFVDGGLSYDGRNYYYDRDGGEVALTTTTMTITGGTTWDAPESLTITSSISTFDATDVGDKVVFWDNDIAYRLEITGYTSPTVVTAQPSKAIPSAYRGVAFTNWEIARDVFRGLDHLNGETVVALVDGNVETGFTVVDGAITVTNHGAVVHVGLPYTAELETLDMAMPQGMLKNKVKNITALFIDIDNSRAVTVGQNSDAIMEEMLQRDPSMGYDRAVPAETDTFELILNTEWSRKGRVIIKQESPLPAAITGISPDVSTGLS